MIYYLTINIIIVTFNAPMEYVYITCDDRTFKTKRETIGNILFGPIPLDGHLYLDTDPDYFEEILEELRVSSTNILYSLDFFQFKEKHQNIQLADIILDIGGKIFHTRKDTLNKSLYFATLFNWNKQYRNNLDISQQSYFIDQEPTKFRKIINYLRNIDPDPGPYADYYLIDKKPKKLIISNQSHHNNKSPIIIKDEGEMIEEEKKRNVKMNYENKKQTKDIERYNNDQIFRANCYFDILKKKRGNDNLNIFVANTSEKKFVFCEKHIDRHTIKIKHHICYINNLQFTTNTGIRNIQIDFYAGSQLYNKSALDAINPYMIKNITNIPKLHQHPYSDGTIIEVTLTRPGILQVGYDCHQEDPDFYDNLKTYQDYIDKQSFYQIQPNNNGLESRNVIPMGHNVSALIIKKNPEFDQLKISYEDEVFKIIDQSNEHLYYNDQYKDEYYYLEIGNAFEKTIIHENKHYYNNQRNKKQIVYDFFNSFPNGKIQLSYQTDIYVVYYNEIWYHLPGVYLLYGNF